MTAKSFLRSRLGRLMIIVVVAFCGGCAYLETKQGDWIFSPVQGEWRGYRGPPQGVEEIWIPVGQNGEKLYAWWSPQPDKNAPTLLYLHGARWNLTGSVTRIPRWNKMGFSVLAIDYRGFGKSTFVDGSSPTEQSANEDAEAAWAYLNADRADPRSAAAKRFIFGHSLGSSMATPSGAQGKGCQRTDSRECVYVRSGLDQGNQMGVSAGWFSGHTTLR